MKSSQQAISMNFSAIDLYNIVLDIEKYPEFVPWCNSVIIKSKSENEILADMIVSYKFFIPQTFTSHVIFNSKKLFINTSYIEGPLNDLKTEWMFNKISEKKTKIIFDLKFEFKNLVHQKMAEFLYKLIEDSMIESFKKRAKDIL